MAVTAADIQAMPGLSAVTTDDANFWLGLAADFVSDAYFTPEATHDQAVKLWTAHALTVQINAGMDSAGPVRSKRVGDVQVGFAITDAAIGSSEWLGSTQWGRLFLQMTRRYLGNVTLAV